MPAPSTTTAKIESITELDLSASYSRRITQATANSIETAAANAGVLKADGSPDSAAWVAGIVGPAVDQALAAQGIQLGS